MNNNTLNQVKGRVLFTGNGTNIIDSIAAWVEDECKVSKCQPNELEFMNAIERQKPHAIIICLQNETQENIYNYDILTNEAHYRNMPVLLVGYDDDCALFNSRIILKKSKTFIRPVNQKEFKAYLKQAIIESRRLLNWDCDEKAVVSHEAAPDHDDSPKALYKKVQQQSLISRKRNILVVDDDVRMLNVLKLYLEEMYDVTVVPSGKLALKYLSKKSADLVLLDYMMPDMDGPQVLKEIRESSSIPEVPVVFLTGVSDKEFVMRGLELRPSGYLLKPISKKDLLDRVTEILLGL